MTGDSQDEQAAARPHSAPMQGLLSHFCEALEQGLAPLLPPLTELLEDFSTEPTALPELLPEWREVADQLAQLVAKMAEQQAYVLIFGPLKSGKSTLMNAICGKYVSEVSCLPAYPCLVHVAHADRTRCQVTRYDGSSESVDDELALTEAVAHDHQLLVEAIRSCEAAGIDFEPQQHATRAIRRIDIRVPAGDLAQSGAVLVDTPGLYARMKFGYDRMTRDFRDAAACAIFVVKTDNLFLDQVFAEFEDLLALFGRIFLVVNLDGTKQDLQADGTLAPSLEHADPQAVVAAFENLAMTAALRDARRDGRLKIYPVDLMQAASQRIRAAAEPTPPDFQALLEDLTAYLNSNEYLRAFVADSMQRAAVLLEDLDGLLGREPVIALQQRVAALQTRQEEIGVAQDALTRVGSLDWGQLLQGPGQRLQEQLAHGLEPRRQQGEEAATALVDAWFEDDSSLAALCHDRLGPELQRLHGEVVALLHGAVAEQMGPEALTAEIEAEQLADIGAAGLDLDHCVRDLLEAAPMAEGLPQSEAVFDSMQLPVRRRLLDWLLLRRAATVRQRLFGPPEAPDLPIQAAEKTRRLGDAGREAMLAQLRGLIAPMFEAAAGALPDSWLARFDEALVQRLQTAMTERRSALATDSEAVTKELEAVQAVVTRLHTLRQMAGQQRQQVSMLQQEVAEMDPAALGRPADGLLPELDGAEDPADLTGADPAGP